MQERNDMQRNPDDLEPRGAEEADHSGPATAEGGTAGDGVTNEAGGIGLENEATTSDAGVAVVGGKLPGNKDDFDGELDAVRPKPVPGADPNNGVIPPNDRDLRQ